MILTTCMTSASSNSTCPACINACGHHHVGNIGILGVDKDGSEWYRPIGGAQGKSISDWQNHLPSFSAGQMPEVIERIQVYLRES